MHADLVGAAGFQPALQRGVGAEALAQAVVGDGVAAVLAHGHAQAVARVAVDRRVGGAAGHQRAAHHRQVLAVHLARGQLLDQSGLRLQAAGHDHHAAGVLVQPVDHAGARHRRQRRVAEQQGVDQGAGGVAGARVDHQPGRLVDHEDVLVLVQHRQRDVLRLGVGLGLQRRIQGGQLAAAHRVAAAHRGAVEQDRPGLDPFAQAGTGELGEQLGQHGVETAAGGGIGHPRLAGRKGSVVGHDRGQRKEFGRSGRRESVAGQATRLSSPLRIPAASRPDP